MKYRYDNFTLGVKKKYNSKQNNPDHFNLV